MKKEILNIFAKQVCIGSDATEHVAVEQKHCPIQRQYKETLTPMFGKDKGKELHLCTCAYWGSGAKIYVPECEHYRGVSKTKDPEEGIKYRVRCTYGMPKVGDVITLSGNGEPPVRKDLVESKAKVREITRSGKL